MPTAKNVEKEIELPPDNGGVYAFRTEVIKLNSEENRNIESNFGKVARPVFFRYLYDHCREELVQLGFSEGRILRLKEGENPNEPGFYQLAKYLNEELRQAGFNRQQRENISNGYPPNIDLFRKFFKNNESKLRKKGISFGKTKRGLVDGFPPKNPERLAKEFKRELEKAGFSLEQISEMEQGRDPDASKYQKLAKFFSPELKEADFSQEQINRLKEGKHPVIRRKKWGTHHIIPRSLSGSMPRPVSQHKRLLSRFIPRSEYHNQKEDRIVQGYVLSAQNPRNMFEKRLKFVPGKEKILDPETLKYFYSKGNRELCVANHHSNLVLILDEAEIEIHKDLDRQIKLKNGESAEIICIGFKKPICTLTAEQMRMAIDRAKAELEKREEQVRQNLAQQKAPNGKTVFKGLEIPSSAIRSGAYREPD